MKFWIVRRMIDAFARRHDYDAAYMLAIYAASPAAFAKFGKVTALAGHCEAASRQAFEAARLAGVLAEDCGPCLQLVADMARANGVADDQIAAVITGDEAAMSPDTALGYYFARAIIARLPEAEALREDVRARWGDKGVVDLTMGAQASRLYPMVKAGLGFAKTCGPIRIGSTNVVPVGHKTAHAS